jgi:hypothetical protein
MNTDGGNMGNHLGRLRGKNDEALERRFGVLLAAHDEELDVYLRQAITMLKQKDIPVNWLQLFKDISAWSHPDGQARVRRAWANSFYRLAAPDPPKNLLIPRMKNRGACNMFIELHDPELRAVEPEPR